MNINEITDTLIKVFPQLSKVDRYYVESAISRKIHDIFEFSEKHSELLNNSSENLASEYLDDSIADFDSESILDTVKGNVELNNIFNKWNDHLDNGDFDYIIDIDWDSSNFQELRSKYLEEVYPYFNELMSVLKKLGISPSGLSEWAIEDLVINQLDPSEFTMNTLLADIEAELY